MRLTWAIFYIGAVSLANEITDGKLPKAPHAVDSDNRIGSFTVIGNEAQGLVENVGDSKQRALF